MARTLTDNERCVLAHVVVDPDGWWEHATNWPKIDEEAALAAKVARWKPSYDGECHQPDYKTRAVKQADTAYRAGQLMATYEVAPAEAGELPKTGDQPANLVFAAIIGGILLLVIGNLMVRRRMD